jgi:hypothetical protein
MYRELLKSMNWCAPDYEGQDHDGAAVQAGVTKQNENRT